jgi:hypothetical protein
VYSFQQCANAWLHLRKAAPYDGQRNVAKQQNHMREDNAETTASGLESRCKPLLALPLPQHLYFVGIP